jgi:hypothetical protein
MDEGIFINSFSRGADSPAVPLLRGLFPLLYRFNSAARPSSGILKGSAIFQYLARTGTGILTGSKALFAGIF